jgi:RPA family protein
MIEQQKRQIAYRLKISDIISGTYVKEEGWIPNYIISNNKKISRVNIIAIVISKIEEGPYSGLVVEDFSGKISVREFGEAKTIPKINVGDAVIIIGKIREFSNAKYIVPEIIRKISDLRWLEIRKNELGTDQKTEEFVEEVLDESEEVVIAEKEEDNDLISLIKKLDKGDGADVSEIIRLSDVDNAEKAIQSLIKNGDVFEVKAGKVKVLD